MFAPVLPSTICAGAWSGRMIASYFSLQPAGADVGVVQRGRLEPVLLEHPARPALVHVAAAERLIHADARRPDAQRRRRRRRGCGISPSTISPNVAAASIHLRRGSRC